MFFFFVLLVVLSSLYFLPLDLDFLPQFSSFAYPISCIVSYALTHPSSRLLSPTDLFSTSTCTHDSPDPCTPLSNTDQLWNPLYVFPELIWEGLLGGKCFVVFRVFFRCGWCSISVGIGVAQPATWINVILGRALYGLLYVVRLRWSLMGHGRWGH
jgi:hypothetical protein